ncbi:hypothetical protein LguiA_014983 [Lonicera macranthoides]
MEFVYKSTKKLIENLCFSRMLQLCLINKFTVDREAIDSGSKKIRMCCWYCSKGYYYSVQPKHY